MGLRSTRAVVSRTMRMSNSSKLAKLISERYGLVTVMGKGARRPRSTVGAALEPITLIDCIYYHHNMREIQTISSAEIIQPYSVIKDNLKLLTIASCVVETAQIHTAEGDVSAGTFDLVVRTLGSLERGVKKDAEKHLWRFMLRLLSASGYRPSLDACVICGKKPKSRSVFFSFADGGVVCSCTSQDDRYGFRVSGGSLMVMSNLLNASDDELSRLGINSRQQLEVEKAVLQFLAWHSGSTRKLKSLAFLRKIEKKKK